MNGLSIVRRVYVRLRRPSQTALPYKDVLATVRDVIARKKLDLALSTQNSLAKTSPWFTPASTDFAFNDLGLAGGVLLPIRVEVRGIDSDLEIGEDVDIVNYEVLDSNRRGAISFYGDPMRIAFSDTLDYIGERQFRIIYESDFEGDTELVSVLGLPDYFVSMVVIEACWELLEQVMDDSAEWEKFMMMANQRWPVEIADKRMGWETYVRMFKGRAAVPKRTFWDNNLYTPTRRRFRG